MATIIIIINLSNTYLPANRTQINTICCIDSYIGRVISFVNIMKISREHLLIVTMQDKPKDLNQRFRIFATGFCGDTWFNMVLKDDSKTSPWDQLKRNIANRADGARVLVFGLTTEITVNNLVEDILRDNKNIAVIKDLTYPIDKEAGDVIMDQWHKQGVDVITMAEALGIKPSKHSKENNYHLATEYKRVLEKQAESLHKKRIAHDAT